ncbi:MAG: hypothetical protein OES13_00360 [Acidimicrobiia bacterium]|nr:hypothetical protein [Acidimicrobiia bacterium]
MVAPTTPEDQLAWKEETDTALGVAQLDMKEIPAKLTIGSHLVGTARADALDAILPLLSQTREAVVESRQPMASENGCNQRWSMVDLEYDTDELTFRLTVNSGDWQYQADVLKSVEKSLALHANRIREQQARAASQPAPLAQSRQPAPLAPR